MKNTDTTNTYSNFVKTQPGNPAGGEGQINSAPIGRKDTGGGTTKPGGKLGNTKSISGPGGAPMSKGTR